MRPHFKANVHSDRNRCGADGKISFVNQRNDTLPEFSEPITLDESEISDWMHSMATEFGTKAVAISRFL